MQETASEISIFLWISELYCSKLGHLGIWEEVQTLLNKHLLKLVWTFWRQQIVIFIMHWPVLPSINGSMLDIVLLCNQVILKGFCFICPKTAPIFKLPSILCNRNFNIKTNYSIGTVAVLYTLQFVLINMLSNMLVYRLYHKEWEKVQAWCQEGDHRDIALWILGGGGEKKNICPLLVLRIVYYSCVLWFVIQMPLSRIYWYMSSCSAINHS